MSKRRLTGINIQYPISKLILDGSKTVETRTYPIPKRYIGQEMALIETPGKEGKFKARIVGLIIFGESFLYNTERSFYKDIARHCVAQNSQWRWVKEKKKWGWPILKVTKFSVPKPAPSRKGIQYTKDISI